MNFTKQYILENCGCYDVDETRARLEGIQGDMIPLKQIAESVPFEDLIWWFVHKCSLSDKDLRLFAAHCAELVLPIYEEQYPTDDRARKAIQAAKDFANGLIMAEELEAAWDAAIDAAIDATRAADRAAVRNSYEQKVKEYILNFANPEKKD